MRATHSLFMFAGLWTFIFAQITIDYNLQTIPDQTLPYGQDCSQAYQIQNISPYSYITISSNYQSSRLIIQASFSSSFNDQLGQLLSYQPGPQTEVLQTALQKYGTGNTIYMRLCRATSDTSAETFSISVSFICNEHYYPVDNKFSCIPCPANSSRSLSSLTLGISGCQCDPGTYLLQNDPNDPNQFQCIVCPEGAYCEGNSAPPQPEDGYYPLNNDGTMIYVRCPFPNACMHSSRNGTTLQVPINLNLQWPIWLPYVPITQLLNISKTNNNMTNVTTQALCAQGYSGYLCGQCMQGYYRLGVRCLSCGNNITTTDFVIFLFVVLLLAAFVLCVPITILNTHVSSFGIVLTFIQISSLFSLFNLEWDEGLLTFFDLLSIFNLNPQVFRLECIAPMGYFAKFMIIFFVPAMYFVFSFLPLICWFLCFRFVRQYIFTKDRFYKLIQWTINSYISVLIVHGYIALSSWTLAYYTCDSYGTYLDKLPADSIARSPRQLWYTSEICSTLGTAFDGYLIFFYVGLGVYVLGVPFIGLVIWYWLIGVSRWRARRNLQEKEKKREENSKELLESVGIGTPTDKPPSIENPSTEVVPEEDEEKMVSRIAEELKNSMASVLVEGRFAAKVVVGFESRDGAVRAFGSIYHRYRPSRFWWEIVVVLRKLGVVLCFAYLEQQPVVAVVLSSVVILVALIMNLYFQPYRKYTSNALESLLLLLQYCMLVLGLMFYASQFADGIPIVGYSSVITSVIVAFITTGLVIGTTALVLELLYEFRRTWYLPTREKMRELAMKNRARNIMKKLKKQRGIEGEQLDDELEHDGELRMNDEEELEIIDRSGEITNIQPPSRSTRRELPNIDSQQKSTTDPFQEARQQPNQQYDAQISVDKTDKYQPSEAYNDQQVHDEPVHEQIPQQTYSPKRVDMSSFEQYDNEYTQQSSQYNQQEYSNQYHEQQEYNQPSQYEQQPHLDQQYDQQYEQPDQLQTPKRVDMSSFEEYEEYSQQPSSPQTRAQPSMTVYDDDDDEEENFGIEDIPVETARNTTEDMPRDRELEVIVKAVNDKKRQLTVTDLENGELYARSTFQIDDSSNPIVVMGNQDDVLFSVRRKALALRPTYLVEKYGKLIGTCTQRFKVGSRKFNLLCANGHWVKLIGEFGHHWAIRHEGKRTGLVGTLWDNKNSFKMKLERVTDEDILHALATTVIMVEQKDSASSGAFKF